MAQATAAPGAQCTARMVYASGSASGSASLKTTETAGSAGGVSWTWKPSTRGAGPATATVHCTLGAQSADGSAQIGSRVASRYPAPDLRVGGKWPLARGRQA